MNSLESSTRSKFFFPQRFANLTNSLHSLLSGEARKRRRTTGQERVKAFEARFGLSFRGVGSTFR